jgi:methyl-accepting chemotaxis protein
MEGSRVLRASISHLLMALLGALVIALLGSTLHIAWEAQSRHAHAGLVQKLAAVDRSIFNAIVTIRSQVPRSQTALVGADDPRPTLLKARREADAELAEALEILAAVDVPGRQGLIEAIIAKRDAVTALQAEMDAQARRPRGARDLKATDPWRLAVFALADSLSVASVAVGNTVRLQDPVIGELVEARWNAWRIRDAFGYQCSALRGNIDRGQPPDERLKGILREKRGATDAAWRALRDLLAHPAAPEALVTGAHAAQAAADAAQTRIDALAAGLDGSGKAPVSGAEWTALCNGPFEPILAIGFTALDIAAAHAEREQETARGRMLGAAVVLALALGLGGLTILIVRRRLSKPVVVLAAAMRELSQGRLDVAIPCADRHDELGEIARCMGGIVNVLRALNEDMQRLSGRLPPPSVDLSSADLSSADRTNQPPPVFEGDFAEMATLMSDARAAFREIGAQATRVAEAAAGASLAVIRVSDGAGTQTADLEAVAVSMGETVQAVAHVSDSARDASEMVRTAAEFADRGKEEMSRMLMLSQTIGENTRKVRNITDSIGEIAETTNILSLNAAIEAARAGAQGRGFAVVAEEVGRLAESAAESAGRVREIVNAASTLAEEGMDVTDATWRMMDDLAGRVMQLDEMIQSIAAAMEQQRVTIAAIEGNFGSVREVAQANAAASQEISVTMRELTRIAEETRELVARFHAC